MKLSSEDGYGVSTGYTYGYYRRLSPTWLRLVASAHGVPFPEDGPFRYFELGFGQGVSLNVHAAANPGEYWGNDYNTEHVAFARKMAEASGASLHLLENSFEELAERSDLPQFQVIVAHGIWSWISESTRAAILKFLDQRLAPGGIFYVSYNALPGSASGMAAQRFLHSVFKGLDPSLPEGERFEIARAHLRAIKDVPGGHFDHYPQAKQRLEKILEGTSAYFLHEYTVNSWQPMLLLEVAAQLEQIGLEFCGSAYLSAGKVCQANEKHHTADALLNETLGDFGSDRMFRSDVFVRAGAQLAGSSSAADIGELEVALTVPLADVDLTPSDPESQATVERIMEMLLALERGPSSTLRICDLVRNELPCEQEFEAVLTALNLGLMHPATAGLSETSTLHSTKLSEFLACTPELDGKPPLRVSPVIGAACQFPALAQGNLAGDMSAEAIISQLTKQEHHGGNTPTAVDVLRYAVNYKSQAKLAKALKLD